MPPVISELKGAASPEGADAVRGGLQAAQEMSARESLLKDDGVEEYYGKRDGRVTTAPQANQRTAGPDRGPLGGGPGAGACGRGSNAARRAHALFDCVTGDSPKPTTTRGPNNPLIARTYPDQMQTPATGAMACLMNGGDMPRSRPRALLRRSSSTRWLPRPDRVRIAGRVVSPLRHMA
jgi:hypothetical protein